MRRYAKVWRREHTAVTELAFVPLLFAPSEAYQFNWVHEIVLVAGVTKTVKVAHICIATRSLAERSIGCGISGRPGPRDQPSANRSGRFSRSSYCAGVPQNNTSSTGTSK